MPTSEAAPASRFREMWLGLGVGLFFVGAVWALGLGRAPGPWTLATLAQLHQTNPGVWLVDLAPLALGGLGWAWGRQRRQAAAARGEAAVLRAVFEDAVVGLAWQSLEGRWLRVNRALCDWLGYSEAEWLALPAAALVHPDDASAEQAQLAELAAGRPAASPLELRFLHKSGRLLHGRVSRRRMRGPLGGLSGAPDCLHVQIEDVTAQKAAEHALTESAERYRWMLEEANGLRQFNAGIVEAMSEGVVLEDVRGCMQMVNPVLLKLLDYEEDELVGRHWSTIVAPASRAEVEAQSVRRAGGVTSSYEASLLAKDGLVVPVLISASPLFRDEQFTGTLAVLINIADRLRAEEALQQTNASLSESLNELERRSGEMALLNEMNDTLQTCLNAEEAHQAMGALLPRLFPEAAGGLYRFQADRTEVKRVAAWGAAAPVETFAPEACWALRRNRPYFHTHAQGELVCQHRGVAAAETGCVPLMAQSEALGLLYLEAPALMEVQRRLAQTVADSLALALANLDLRENLRQQSVRDPLTGLFNRRYMQESLERELRRAARHQMPVGIIMLDLDHFKQFNDTYGHAAGDSLLRDLSAFLTRYIRGGDIACRYGGEEFILILPEAAPEVARQRAEQLCADARRLRPEHQGQALGAVTVSVGVAAYPAQGATVDLVLRAADAALYQAKRLGRNQVAGAE